MRERDHYLVQTIVHTFVPRLDQSFVRGDCYDVIAHDRSELVEKLAKVYIVLRSFESFMLSNCLGDRDST
eukprot:COSAG02_NODE_2261_length_9322_cov_152.037298_4_plen_70_part_00